METCQASNKHAGDGAGLEGDIETGCEAMGCGLGRAKIGPYRNMHADETGSTGKNGANDETDCGFRREKNPRSDRDDDTNDCDGQILTCEISLSSLANIACYFTHALVALIGIQNALRCPNRISDR